MHFMPLTDGKRSRAGMRSAEEEGLPPSPTSRSLRGATPAASAAGAGSGAGADAAMSGRCEGRDECEGEPLGTLAERRDEGAFAGGLSELLKTDEAEVA